jgi:hypothetical protein
MKAIEPAWQPIETAPRKTKLLLSFPHLKHPMIGWFNEADQQFEIIDYFKDNDGIYIPPTHWMLLPNKAE